MSIFHKDPNHPEIALIVSDGDARGCVLFSSTWFQFEQQENGLHTLEELDLADAPAGVSVWEGCVLGGERDDWNGDYNDTYLSGEFRKLTDEEWAAVKETRSPWPERTRDYGEVYEEERRLEVQKAIPAGHLHLEMDNDAVMSAIHNRGHAALADLLQPQNWTGSTMLVADLPESVATPIIAACGVAGVEVLVLRPLESK